MSLVSISLAGRCTDDQIHGADVVGFFLPMHTATRLALPVIDRVRVLNPAARLIAYGCTRRSTRRCCASVG